nr:G5 domain-containing protein [Agromyces aureus]
MAVVGVVILALWGWGGLLVVSGLIAGTVGLYALLRGSFSRLRIQTRPVGVAVLVAGIVVASVGGAAVAANQPADHDVAAFVDAGVASPRASASAPTPTPTPVRKETIVEESAPIAFSTSNVDDPNLDVGLTALATAGADGQKVIRTRVVTVDGVEVSREVVEEIVTVQPVNEIIAVGSRQPPPPPPAPVDNGCDSNYEGACVPISSDVDCAGGSGNGPAYVQGPVWIVGSDIYDLDRDGDGVACDA